MVREPARSHNDPNSATQSIEKSGRLDMERVPPLLFSTGTTIRSIARKVPASETINRPVRAFATAVADYAPSPDMAETLSQFSRVLPRSALLHDIATDDPDPSGHAHL